MSFSVSWVLAFLVGIGKTWGVTVGVTPLATAGCNYLGPSHPAALASKSVTEENQVGMGFGDHCRCKAVNSCQR